MRVRVGVALLLVMAGGVVGVVALRPGREHPLPPAAEPPAVVLPLILPDAEPVRVPVETPWAEDPPGALESLPRKIDLPDHPIEIDVRDRPDLTLRTGESGDGSIDDPDSPKPVPPEVEPPPDPPAPPSEPEKPPEEEPKVVTGRDAPPLRGPIEDPEDLPTPKEIEEGETPVPGKPEPEPEGILAALNDALRIMTLDGRVQIKAIGRLYFDAALMNAERSLEERVGPFESGYEFRALRLGLLGVAAIAEFKIDYDFAGGQVLLGEPDLKDLWVGARDVPLLGRVRIGRMKEPLGLEQWMSGNVRTFMEPALPKALTIGRNPGILAFDTELEGRLAWWVGVYGYTAAGGSQFGKWGTNVSARVCGTPWYEEEGRRLLHLGVSGSFRSMAPDQMSIGSRPESHQAPTIVATPAYAARRQQVLGLECAFVDGPWSLQGELQGYAVDKKEGGRSIFWGAYLNASFMFTGEHRVYRRGTFFRPRVESTIFDDPLGGAWEVAARFSHLDLKSGGIDGGVVTNATLGMNWYMDNHARFMINFIRTHRQGVGSANILQCRIQIDF